VARAPQLNSEQRQVLATILRVGRRVGASRKDVIAAIETGLVESNLTNPAGGDADSQGFRQERTSIYGARHAHNVRLSAQDLYREMKAVEGQYRRPGALAAAVQRPAAQYRGRYAQVGQQARQLLAAYGGGQGAPGGAGGAQFPSSYTQTTTTTPGVDNTAARLASVQSFLGQGGVKNSNALLQFASVYPTLKDTAPKTTVRNSNFRYGSTAGGTGAGAGTQGRVSISPTADRPGASINPGVVKFVRRIAGLYGKRLTIGTGTNHSRLTVNGTVSDHYAGNAADVPLTGRALIKAGQDALIAAGMPASKARKISGGGFNVGKWQVIFNTDAPGWGNHLTHLHVGYSKNR
jgi:hypothetical protein